MNILFPFAVIGGGLLLFLGKKASASLSSNGDKKDNSDGFFTYDEFFKYYANMHNIPWEWLKAISIVESDLGRDARVKNGLVSGDGLSYGIMQIASGTGSPKERELKKDATPEELNNPETSIRIAADLLGYLYQTFYVYGEEFIIKSYNQGEVNTWKEITNGTGYTKNYFTKFQKALTEVNRREL